MRQHILLAFALLLAPALLLAETALHIIDPWSPEAPPGRMMAGFMALHNHSDVAVALVDARSPQFAHVEIHTMVMEDGVMRMRRLDELVVEPHETITLQPGGLHLMFIEPLTQPGVGDRIAVELIDDQGRLYPFEAEVRVRQRPAAGNH